MNPDVIVAGGGPAGAAAACHLAGGGARVLVIERDPEPRHKVCGEFLSIETQDYLADLGIDACRLGAAPIERLRFVHGEETGVVDLPFRGVGLTRRRMDAALLRAAQDHGAQVRRGAAVRAIVPAGPDLAVPVGDACLTAPRVLLATGKHDVRGLGRPPGDPGDLIGFKTYFTLERAQREALDGHIEVVMFAGGYAGLQLVENGLANLCLVVSASFHSRLGRSWAGLLGHLVTDSAHLAARLRGARESLERPLAVARIPYGFVHRPAACEPPGLYRLGDQAGVIPSFAGDGMAIALHSAQVAARAIAAGEPAQAHHTWLAADIGPPIRLASLLYRLSGPTLGRDLLVWTARMAPSAVRLAATRTRVPLAALNRARASGAGRAAKPLAETSLFR